MEVQLLDDFFWHGLRTKVAPRGAVHPAGQAQVKLKNALSFIFLTAKIVFLSAS